jgi:hypothetical protein
LDKIRREIVMNKALAATLDTGVWLFQRMGAALLIMLVLNIVWPRAWTYVCLFVLIAGIVTVTRCCRLRERSEEELLWGAMGGLMVFFGGGLPLWAYWPLL